MREFANGAAICGLQQSARSPPLFQEIEVDTVIGPCIHDCGEVSREIVAVASTVEESEENFQRDDRRADKSSLLPELAIDCDFACLRSDCIPVESRTSVDIRSAIQ